ncbi:MAG: A/G-specific adenine glycosylase [Patescibacteria group bacterium]
MDKRAWVQRRLLHWYAKHQRDLPWRRTKNPYYIVVSEVMLQQTQVDRVVPKYRAFLKKFPTLQKLAHAPQGQVIAAWSGLGYNRRARNLHQLAQQVVRNYGGKLPRTPQELQTLPGIGPYTAAAVACFAFAAPVALVEVNVRRVLGRLYHGVRGPATLTEPAVWKLAARQVPKQSVAWNSALMDFGATVCIARLPKCATCPLQARCAAYPAVLNQAPAPKKSTAPFTDSDRFWRGRIIHRLHVRQKQLKTLRTLQAYFFTQGLPGQRFRALLKRLVAEKLVEQRGRAVSL